ncbi:amidase [Pseudooceanicola algae]|uniref:6-aminohexanoate-cyclic-dimer hydrolase n=1 Tax=Pseudooceanicola algae TaxID=1537215 RepID=A0A418SIP1_9RHOB|nr:amidase [Pseudooceanicola algae]QPM91176.1 6-aminohexanoate-cyclic-dimer hydrolase [Pseudooceanicola algae]
MISEYDTLDATALAALVRSGEVTSQEVLATALDRIARLEPQINAIVHPHFDLAQADIVRGLPDGPFTGVPMLVKNTGIAVAGMEMSTGCRLFQGMTDAADCTLVARYRKAGVVLMGKSNTPEFALSFATEPATSGPTCNPWNKDHGPGGSSGGSAAAVAAGLVPFANSSDGAGSTRLPASHTGLFGFKPSRMRNPLGPVVVEGIAGMSTPHALTRSVRDSAALLDATAGGDVGDPSACPPVHDSFATSAARDPGPLRIGMTLDSPLGTPVDPQVRAACVATARLLESLGHHVEEITDAGYDAHALKTAWRVIPGVNVASAVTARGAMLGLADPVAELEPVNRAWIREGMGLSGMDYLAAVNLLHRTARDMGRFFAGYDILLTPGSGELPPRIGEMSSATGDSPADLDAFYDRFWQHSPFTCVFNSSGCPAMNLPFGLSVEGLPIGVHFGAGYGQDALLFSLAGQIERAAPWAHRRPNLTEKSPA